MNIAKARSAYQQSESQAQIHPVKLIHLLYERVLIHLELAEEGILTADVKARGENLSKAIAIITELNASIKEGDASEAAAFLRGLYSAILLQLPKVGLTNDVETIRQSYRYMNRLREIWEATAMVEAGLTVNGSQGETPKEEESGQATPTATAPPPTTAEYGGPKKFKAMDAAACYLHGVSVSI